MSTTLTPAERKELTERIGRGARRFGYVVAAVINAVLLWIVHQLPDWEWPGFLTDDFDRVLPYLTASFVASIFVDLVFAVDDGAWRRPLGELATAATGLLAAWRMWTVFPFEFTGTDWSWLGRTVLAVGIAGTAIGVVAHASRLLRFVAGERSGRDRPS